MTLSRDVVVPGILAQYGAFATSLVGLSVEEWEAPSRCSGWRAGDVAAHVVGQLTDVVNLRLEGVGTPEVTQRQVDERRGQPSSELVGGLNDAIEQARGVVAGFDAASWERGSGITRTFPREMKVGDEVFTFKGRKK
jgi:uncharacterized protein (TIGR03083 family)